MRFGLRRQLGLGIVGVLATIAVLCFILMSVLFSRTYDMLSTALAAKGKAEAASLAARVPFALTTKDYKEIAPIFSTDMARPQLVEPIAGHLRGLLHGDARGYLKERLGDE